MNREEIETLKDTIHTVLEEQFNDERRRPFNATRMIRQILDEQLMPKIEVAELQASEQIVEDLIAEEVQRRIQRGDHDRYVEVERVTRLRRWHWRNNAEEGL